jgi:tripartite-type tricarboxylate transporter receptor subunit TctC
MVVGANGAEFPDRQPIGRLREHRQEAVVRAPADGYTLLLAGSSDFTNATVFEKLPFNFIRDIAQVAGILRAPLVMEVNPSVPVRTVPEFIAYARANPGKINMGSAGVMSRSILCHPRSSISGAASCVRWR